MGRKMAQNKVLDKGRVIGGKMCAMLPNDVKNYRAPLGAFQLIAQEYAGEILFCIFLLALLLDKLGV